MHVSPDGLQVLQRIQSGELVDIETCEIEVLRELIEDGLIVEIWRQCLMTKRGKSCLAFLEDYIRALEEISWEEYGFNPHEQGYFVPEWVWRPKPE